MKHILIVDDNKTSLTAARNVLSNLYKVTAVTMGAQALRFLESNSCDLILLDINMPEMDGFQVMEKIREIPGCAETPIVFLTADDDAETESRCLEAGALDFIAKPFVNAVMLSRIGRILETERLRQLLAEQLQQKIQEVCAIQNRSQQDVLTGLWNRCYTEQQVTLRISEHRHGAVMMLDMDNFKAINDTYGHVEGDRVLRMFADTMRSFAGEEDLLCRIGGDEFLMYVESARTKEALSRMAASIIEDIAARLAAQHFETNTSVSIGIAQCPEDGTSFQNLYNAADKALYYVKQNGKNSYYFFREQQAGDEARGQTTIDLQYLHAMLVRADSSRGVSTYNLDAFRHIYHFARMYSERSRTPVLAMLLTLHCEGAAPTQFSHAMEQLEQAVFSAVRRADSACRYSNRQLMVLLVGAGADSAETAAARIRNAFAAQLPEAGFTLTYEASEIYQQK